MVAVLDSMPIDESAISRQSCSAMQQTNFRKLLVIDDDPIIAESLALLLPANWSLTSYQNPAQIPEEWFDAAFVDLHFRNICDYPPLGLKIIEQLRSKFPQMEIVAISGDLRSQLMDECLQHGAHRFLAKPLIQEEVYLVLDRIDSYLTLKNLNRQAVADRPRWIGQDEASQAVLRQISLLRGDQSPVLIEGESGTGKEVVAALLHLQERERPWVVVNLSAIPENLIEAELFGHVKGTFTGADSTRAGLFEAAHNGDLFLDELEALPLHIQPKLLRFLENGEVRRVGSRETQIISTRIIGASNQSLLSLVQQGKFREDLYFRLCSQRIQLPALRERGDDFDELAKFFLRQKRPSTNKYLSPEALIALKKHSWPGNVRELKRILDQLCILSPLPLIRTEDVYMALNIHAPTVQEEKWTQELLDFVKGLPELIADYEAKIIRQVLNTHPNYRIDEIADLLKISRSNLYKKMKDYQIEPQTRYESMAGKASLIS